MTSAYQWMVPFLHRCEKQSPGVAKELLREYLVTLAKGDLKLPLKIFQHSKPDVSKSSVQHPRNVCAFPPAGLGFSYPFLNNRLCKSFPFKQKWLSFYCLENVSMV